MQTEQFAVLGAGLMGVGIATHFARFGHDIWLYDTEQSRIAEIHVVAGGILDELISCEQFTAPEKENVLKRLHGTTSLADIADSQLLIEAIPERLELKHALYTELETLISPEAIVASNTSGLPPDDLAAKMRYPQRLLIAHFWHPPHFIPLVEIIPAALPSQSICTGCNTCLCHCNWKQCCWIALRQDLSATVCNLHCCVKPCIS